MPDSILKVETVNSNTEILAFKDTLDSSRKKCKKTDKYSLVLDNPQSIALPRAGLVWRLLTDIWGRWDLAQNLDHEDKVLSKTGAPILWPTDANNWLIEKDPDAGKDQRQEEKGMAEDEMVGWHHWLDGHEFEQAPGVRGQGSLACCSPRGHKELDMTDWMELNWKVRWGNGGCPGIRIAYAKAWRWSGTQFTQEPCPDHRRKGWKFRQTLHFFRTLVSVLSLLIILLAFSFTWFSFLRTWFWFYYPGTSGLTSQILCCVNTGIQ